MKGRAIHLAHRLVDDDVRMSKPSLSANPRLCIGLRLIQVTKALGEDFADERDCFSYSAAQRSLEPQTSWQRLHNTDAGDYS